MSIDSGFARLLSEFSLDLSKAAFITTTMCLLIA